MKDEQNPYEPPKANSPPISETVPRSSPDRLLVLATFDNTHEANHLKNELEANGIQSSLGNENTAQIFNMTFTGPSSAFWVEVLVHEKDADRGLKIKSDFLNTKSPKCPEWRCKCGEIVDEGFAVCWNCNTDYPG